VLATAPAVAGYRRPAALEPVGAHAPGCGVPGEPGQSEFGRRLRAHAGLLAASIVELARDVPFRRDLLQMIDSIPLSGVSRETWRHPDQRPTRPVHGRGALITAPERRWRPADLRSVLAATASFTESSTATSDLHRAGRRSSCALPAPYRQAGDTAGRGRLGGGQAGQLGLGLQPERNGQVDVRSRPPLAPAPTTDPACSLLGRRTACGGARPLSAHAHGARGTAHTPVLPPIKILTIVGDGSAFPTARHLAAYTGLAPVTRRSGSSIKGETRSQRGNHALKSALFVSAFASLGDPAGRVYYDRNEPPANATTPPSSAWPAAASTSSTPCSATAAPTSTPPSTTPSRPPLPLATP
jgi:Transposase IS116/IS110/IS902 family